MVSIWDNCSTDSKDNWYPHDNCCKIIHFLGISHFNLLIPCLKACNPCSPKEMVKRWWGLRQVSNYHSPTNFQSWWANPEITAGTSPFLVGGLEHFLFSINIFWIILPIDFHIFQRGRYTTNQPFGGRNAPMLTARSWRLPPDFHHGVRSAGRGSKWGLKVPSIRCVHIASETCVCHGGINIYIYICIKIWYI